jgi:hypothetical protein
MSQLVPEMETSNNPGRQYSISSLNVSSLSSKSSLSASTSIASSNFTVVVQDATIDTTREHIKFMGVFSLLCCWCFPFTGLASIFYTRRTRLFYKSQDFVRARQALNTSEWLMLATVCFGVLSLSFGLLLLEVYVFHANKGLSRSGAVSDLFGFASHALPK